MVSRLLIVLGLALSTLGEARFLPLRHSSPHYEAHREYHRGHLARIQVLNERAVSTNVSATLLGCFTDASDRTLSSAQEFVSSMTPNLCLSWCGGEGYHYAGVEAGNELETVIRFNVEVYPRYIVNDEVRPRFDVGVERDPHFEFEIFNLHDDINVENGQRYDNNVEFDYQCYCGNTLDPRRRTNDSSCSTACSGDSSAICGGPSLLNVYALNSGSTTGNTSFGTCIGCSAVLGAAPPPSAAGTKALYAHHIVGNTYSYTQATWADDIGLASAAGIDGFALNLGSDAYEPSSVTNAFAAAEAHGSFKLFLSLDFTSLSCSSISDASNVAALISTYSSSSAQVTYSAKTLVGSFSGDACTFGQSNVTSGWLYVRSLLFAGNVTIHLIPAIFPDPSTFSTLTWMDGELNWNSGWPLGATNLDDSSDILYMNALRNKTYMPAISPCFFTYYSPSSYNKDWIYRSDDWLLAIRMEMLVAMRSEVDMAEIISWNDYGESHYIGPIRADQPNSQGWTNGMPHTAWLGLIAYYAPAFKTGVYPSATDNLWLWTRPHPKTANATAPSMAKPTRWDDTDDNLYAVVTLSSPANVTIYSGTNTGSWSLPSGISKLSLASLPGVIGGKIVRGSSTVKTYDSTGTFTYVATPTDYNFNYFVAQA
ncbi:MAG: hypothetical protein TREMPRED_005793 [Tremellales sp. Tagirdzhanova-0007]|nr:MAG: hypothetical protein TREMPRED_005793 [Tremellales sp. Tagirdzhanova-0007]